MMANVIHSRDSHNQKLNQLCRVCGERARDSKGKFTPKLCENYAETLLCFNLNVNNDTDGIHPKTMCKTCYQRLMHVKSNKLTDGITIQNVIKDIERSHVLWVQYDARVSESSSIVCSTYDEQRKGAWGRQNKVLGFKPLCQSPSVSDLSSVVSDDQSFLDPPSHGTTPIASLYLKENCFFE